MKTNNYPNRQRCCFKEKLYVFFLACFFPVCMFGQVGNTLQDPIVIAPQSSSFRYANTQNTNHFTNDYTMRSPKDVFYRFTLTTAMEVQINHCGSVVSDTYLHLLDEAGNRIAYNDDWGDNGCATRYLAYLKTTLGAGTYYVVSEGYSLDGEITTNIEGVIPRVTYTYDMAGNRVGRFHSQYIPQIRSAFLAEAAAESGEIEPEEINIDDNMNRTLGDYKVTISPNPTNGLLTVEIAGYENSMHGEIRALSMEGKVLQKQGVTSASTQIDLTDYPAGLYLLSIHLNGETMIRKIVKN